MNGMFLQAGARLRLFCSVTGPGPGGHGVTDGVDAGWPACWRRRDLWLLSGTAPTCTVPSSGTWKRLTSGLLAPGVPLKETGIPLVERFLDFEQGGSFLRIWGIGRQGSQMASVVKRAGGGLAGPPSSPQALPGGFCASTWNRTCGVPAVVRAWWGHGMQAWDAGMGASWSPSLGRGRVVVVERVALIQGALECGRGWEPVPVGGALGLFHHLGQAGLEFAYGSPAGRWRRGWCT